MTDIASGRRHGESGAEGTISVLVVEDNDDLRSLLEDVLDDAGFAVTAVANGADALELLETWQPAAIVLDLMMPVMDGPTFLQRCRAVPALAALPVLVLTAHPFHYRVLDGLSPTAVLRKPYDVEELIAAVQALCDGETGRDMAG